MKYIRKVASAFLILCMCFSLVPHVSADNSQQTTPQYALQSLSPSDDETSSVSVGFLAESDCTLLIGIYDGNGRLFNAGIIPVTGSPESQTLPITLPDTLPTQCTIRAFLTDPQSYSPLCRQLSLENPFNDGYDYAIAELTVEGRIISAAVSSKNACTLHLEILDENATRTLFSAELPVSAQTELEVFSAECFFSLPAHFLARATLQNSRGEALCDPYTNRRYTSYFQSFAELTEDDFSGSTVLDLYESNDGNFAVLTEDVRRLSSVPLSRTDGQTVFPGTEELPAIQSGEKLCFLNADGQYVTIRAASVDTDENGNIVITEDSDITVSDFYRVIKIDAVLTNQTPSAPRMRSVRTPAASPDSIANIQMGPEFTLEVPTPFGRVSGTAKTGAALQVYYDPALLGKDYMEFACLAKVQGELDLMFGISSHIKGELPLLNIPLAGVGDAASIPLKLSMSYDFKGDAGFNVTLSFEETAGYIYNTKDGGQKIRQRAVTQEESALTTNASGRIDLETGLKFSMSADILCGLLEVGIGAETGVGIEGEITALNASPLDSYTASHACYLCCSGRTYGFMEMEIYADYQLSTLCKGSIAELDLVRMEWNIGTFYLSGGNAKESVFGGKASFGWAEKCPNQTYRAVFRTYDETGQEVPKCTVTILNQNGEEIASGRSPYSRHLYPGTYTACAQVGKGYAEETFTVSDGPVDVYLHAQLPQLKGTVTDRETGEPISGIFVQVFSDGVLVGSDTSGSGGYSIPLTEGNYTVEFSGEGYEPETRGIAFHQTYTMDVSLQIQYCTVHFLAGDGSGTMDSVKVGYGRALTLPDCSFTAPEGKKFHAWSLDGGIYGEGATYNSVTSNLSFTAQFKPPMFPVKVTVLDPDGNPVPDVAVQGFGYSAYQVTGSDGTVTFELEAGNYCLHASTYKKWASQEITLNKETEVVLQLAPASLSWNIDEEEKVLFVSGNGTMPAYSNRYSMPWYRSINSFQEVRISSGITSVSNYAFTGCGISKVSLPSSITNIYDSSFRYNNLTHVDLPDNIRSIGKYTFASSGLQSIKFSRDLSSIGDHAFELCHFKELVLPENLFSIGTGAFTGCSSLTSITFPNNRLYSIGSGAFQRCSALTEVTLPDTLYSVGAGLFYDCASLKSAIFPENITEISSASMFYNCSSLIDVTLPKNLPDIGANAFYNCTTLKALTIPASVTSIGSYAFNGCGALTDIYFTGTEEQWNAITIESGNEPLLSATIHFADSPDA